MAADFETVVREAIAHLLNIDGSSSLGAVKNYLTEQDTMEDYDTLKTIIKNKFRDNTIVPMKRQIPRVTVKFIAGGTGGGESESDHSSESEGASTLNAPRKRPGTSKKTVRRKRPKTVKNGLRRDHSNENQEASTSNAPRKRPRADRELN